VVNRRSALPLAIAAVLVTASAAGTGHAVPAGAPASTITVGVDPAAVVVAPDGSRAYVANASSATVSVINTASGSVVASYRVGGNPTAIATSPDGTRLYVTSAWTDSLTALDAATGHVLGRVVTGQAPDAVVVSPDGARVYVANANSEDVAIVDTPTMRVTTRIPVGDLVEDLAISPDGSRVYALLTAPPSRIRTIDATTTKVTQTIRLGRWASAIAISPDGSRGYVTTSADLGRDGAVLVVDLAGGAVSSRIPLGLQPDDVQFAADATRLYVLHQGSGQRGRQTIGSNPLVSAINTGDGSIEGTIELTGPGARGNWAASLALNLHGSEGYAALGGSRRLGIFAQAPVPHTPTQPLSVHSTVSGTTATVRWTAPASGGSAVTGYVVTAVPMAEGPQERIHTCSTTSMSCRFTGLTRGLAYEMQVQARSAQGWSPVAAGRLIRIR
jgi:YVTN family beta-propeller protein